MPILRAKPVKRIIMETRMRMGIRMMMRIRLRIRMMIRITMRIRMKIALMVNKDDGNNGHSNGGKDHDHDGAAGETLIASLMGRHRRTQSYTWSIQALLPVVCRRFHKS